MIVRISTEGQYRLDSDLLDTLNEHDNKLVDIIADGDEAGFKNTFADMLALVRDHGAEVEAEEIFESDVILPPPDLTFKEARNLFTGEGVIPD